MGSSPSYLIDGRKMLKARGFLEHELEMVSQYELKQLDDLKGIAMYADDYPFGGEELVEKELEKAIDLLYKKVLLREKGFTENQISEIIHREELARLSVKQLSELSSRGILKIFDLDPREISVHIVDDEPISKEEKLKQEEQELEQEKKQLAEEKRILKMQKKRDKKLAYKGRKLAKQREKLERQKLDYQIQKIDYERKKLTESRQQLELQTSENTAQKGRKLVCRNNRIYSIELGTEDKENELQTVKSTPKKKANLFELIKRFISRGRERE